ncbi:MAG: hypothetical protein HOJ88_05215, partial [Proteobacteria bacterium]|nr:hypothetical protein [Pseudomonadota bacterium]
MRVSSQFDSGNIVVLDGSNPGDIQLEISKDNKSDFYQWFYFRVTGAKGELCRFKIVNAGGAAYPSGWENYQAVCSSDGRLWKRIETKYVEGVLEFTCKPDSDAVYIAYFAPYSQERHANLISRMLQTENVRLEVL